MVTKAKPKQQQPRAMDRKLALIEAKDKAIGELEALRRERAKALNDLLDDPSSDALAAAADALGNKITSLESRLEMFDQAVAKAEKEVRDEIVVQRAKASAADRAAILAIADHRRNVLAPAVDAALDQLRKAVVAYRAAGESCSAFVRSALHTQYGSDHYRLNDRLVLSMPRSTGNGADVAVAFAYQLRKISEAMNSPALQAHVEFNPFSPCFPSTLADACRMDNVTLRSWFAEPAPQPQTQEAT